MSANEDPKMEDDVEIQEESKVYVIWKHGQWFTERQLAKGDGRGPLSDTGLSRKYVWNRDNNHTVDDMTPEDVELIRTFVDSAEFRITDGLPKSKQVALAAPVMDDAPTSPNMDGTNGPGSGTTGRSGAVTTTTGTSGRGNSTRT